MKRKVKQWVALLLAVVVSVSSFAGCSGSSTATSGTSTAGTVASAASGTQTAKPTSDKFITVLVEGGSPGYDVAKATAAKFKEQTGYEVVIDAIPYSGIYDKLMTEIKSGTATHDIATLDVLWLPAFKSGLLDLSSMATDEVKNDSMPKLIEGATLGGQLLGYPMWTNCKVLLYRKDLFENAANKTVFKSKYGYELKAPTTWKEYTDCAQFFTKDNMYGTTVFGSNGGDSVCSWLDHVAQAGAKDLVLDKDNKVLIDQQPYVDALNFLKDLYAKGYTPKETLSVASTESEEMFKNGKVAMQLAWAHQYTDACKVLTAAKVGVAPMIAGSAGIGVTTGPWYQSILKASKKTDIAQKYLQFMFDNNSEYMKASLKIAGRKSVVDEYSKQPGYEHMQAMLTSLNGQQSQNRPATEHWTEIEEVLAGCVQNTLGGKDAKTELAAAKKSIEDIIG